MAPATRPLEVAGPRIDPNTGRPLGDHGTANDALEWMWDHSGDVDPGNQAAFLECWRDGSAFEEWPEYYVWMKENGR